MPRLSVGIEAIGPDVAVLSRDLHQLVDSTALTRWYSWGESAEAIARAKEDLLSTGLPWLDEHLAPDGIVRALELERHPPQKLPARAWWQLGRRRNSGLAPAVNLNVLQALSYGYELQGRYEAALDTWAKYIEGHPLLQKGTELECQLTERLRSLSGASRAGRD